MDKKIYVEKLTVGISSVNHTDQCVLKLVTYQVSAFN